jgi:dTDP-4-dehydrorhamnose reductase
MTPPSPPVSPKAAERRILLTGPTGQVGHELAQRLRSLGQVIAAGRTPGAGVPALDLAQPDSIVGVVRAVRPHLIVNAAAYTAVDRAETQADLAMAANGAAPGILAEEARRLGAGLVHYSTDYVFDGSGTRPWREDDPTGPLNAYGRSKLAGETAIQAAGVAHLILRTSWVHGVHGGNFVKTMLRLAGERSSLKVVDDQFGAPTSAAVVADVTVQILAQATTDLAAFLRERGGLLHVACAGETSWHAFAREIFQQASRRGALSRVPEVLPISSAEYPAAARRPANSRLDCTRLAERFGIRPPHWKAALEETLEGVITAGRVSASVGANLPSPSPSPEGREGNRTTQPTDTRRPADLDVGVIYTHERGWMPRLLPTLACSGDDVKLRLILVDNASADGTAPWESLVPRTTVLRNTQRLGYAPNLNRILEASTAPLVLLLNTDMEFDPAEQCLSKMVRFMRDHPDCGLAGCRLYHPDGTYGYPARRFQTLGVIAGRRTPLAPFFRRAVDHYRYLDQPHTQAFDCDWLSGCFLLMRRAACDEVGPFDCRFAKYFEDVDMCLRMARAGWRVMFNGGTYCYHGEERASRKVLSRDALLHLRSYYRWIKKWGWRPNTLTRSLSAGDTPRTELPTPNVQRPTSNDGARALVR